LTPSSRGSPAPHLDGATRRSTTERTLFMGYGLGGILITILVILAIIYFAKRV